MAPVSADGVTMSVVGLYPLCVQGFAMVQGLFNAPQTVKPVLAMLFIQSGVFLTWGEWWGLGDVLQARPVRAGKTKLEAYFANTPGIGQRVLAVLIEMSNTFSNVRHLELHYNLKIQDESGVDLQDLDLDAGKIDQGENPINQPAEMKKRQRHMEFLRRAKFVVEDGKGLEKFASQIDYYIEVLLKLCPEKTVQKIERAMLNRFLWDRSDSQELLDIQWAAKEEAVRKCNIYQRYKIYDLLASIAGFRADVKSRTAEVPIYSSEGYQYGGGRQIWDFNDGEGTMAISNRYGLVRFVEWKYYRKTEGVENGDDIRDIKRLAGILGNENRPAEIRSLKCLGIFKDPARNRYGLLYQPPTYIEEIEGEKRSPNAVPKSRKPVSLFHLLKKTFEPVNETITLDLSVRFRLAKQIVQSVYVMHAAGLLHKNLRAQSILFLPAESQHGGPSRCGRKRYDQPWISGYGRSTSDEPEIMELEASLDSKALWTNLDKKRDAWYGDQALPKEIRRKPCRRMTDFAHLGIYQHPERRLDPTRRYTAAYDVYSLGCVLLEIGLWQSLESFDEDYNPLQFQGILIELSGELVGQMGSKYAAAVKECLSITSTDGQAESDLEAGRILCWKVAAALDGCSA